MASVVPSAVVTPSPPDLLAAWESGQEAGIVQRGVALLAAALPGQPSDALSAMTPGERDVRLLQVHRALFGPRLECVMSCEECSHDLELTLAVADLLACAAEGHPAAADEHGAGNPAELVSGGWRVSFRLLELGDLAEAASAAGP